MKLLLVHQHFGAKGGAENTLLLTASELRDRGHEVGLLYNSLTGNAESDWAKVFGSSSYCISGAGNVEQAEAVLEGFNPDVLFVHNFSDLAVFECLLASSLPIVRMVHDHGLYCMREYKYNYFTRAICNRPASGHCVFPCMATVVRNRNRGFPVKFASYSDKMRELELNRRCDRFLVYSDYCRQELVQNGFEGANIHTYVPTRMPDTDFVTSAFSNRNLVLFAGQIIRGKGVDVLLKALSKVKVPFECVIMGDGSHRGHCERLSKNLGLTSKVTFTGFLSRDEARAYYLDASVFAVSSVWPEPFGLVGPEAMRFGLPVVAFDAGGIKEWLHHNENGFLVPWMDTDAYAAAVESLLRDKELGRTMGARGKARVAQDYDFTSQISTLEDIFSGLLKGRSAPINENAGINVVHGNG